MQQINPDIKTAYDEYNQIAERLSKGEKIDQKTLDQFTADLKKLTGNSTVPESVKKELNAAMQKLGTPDQINISALFQIGVDLSKASSAESGWPQDVSDAIQKLNTVMGKAPKFDISDFNDAKKELQEALKNPLLTDEQKEKITNAIGKLDQFDKQKPMSENFAAVAEALAALTE